MENYGYIYENFEALSKEVALLARAAGREVTLVSVTKSGTDEEFVELLRAGAADIGENRPGELARRGGIAAERGFDIRLHEIGNLQRNKVKLIINSVALIHSLDSLELALEIDKQAGRVGRRVPVLIEINSGREESKGGIMPEEAETFFLRIRELANISVAGIMTMGPVCDESEDIRPYFRLTKEIFDRLNKTYGFEGGGILSMGMSDSYAVAIEEGSTLIRVGRRLFNKRSTERIIENV